MNPKIKKATIPMRIAFKLGLSGHWVLRSFTILILSICFTALGLISSFFTGNYTDAFIDCVLNSTYEYTTFCFRDSDELYDSTLVLSGDREFEIDPLGQEVMDFIEEETGRDYIHVLSYKLSLGELKYYTGIVNANGVSNDLSLESYCWGVYAKNEATYEDFGFEVLAGRYPEDVYEIAVSEKQFEYFKRNGGYRDRSDGFYYDRGDVMLYDYSRVAKGKAEPINNYEDLIGKTIVCEGDENTGGFYFVKIVGVIDTHADESLDTYSVGADYYHYTPKSKIFISTAWVNKFYPDGDYISTYMCTQKATTRVEAKDFVDITEKARTFADTLIAKKQAEAKTLNVTSDGLGLIETYEFNFRWLEDLGYCKYFGGAGGVFGVFTVVLVIYLTNATLNGKRRQIGVLRAIGAGKRDVAKIVFSGVGFNSVVSFAVSVLATFLLYKLWLYDIFYRSYLSAGFVFFNAWNVLILAAMAIIVPLLASLPALFRFSKRTVAELLTDRKDEKKRK